MFRFKKRLVAVVAATVTTLIIVCAHAQVQPGQREVLSFNELERDVDYVILEIEGHEYFASDRRYMPYRDEAMR